MAYNNFTLIKVKKDFELTIDENQNLFQGVEAIAASDFLTQTLDYYLPLATTINTDKARSEFIIAPIMGEVKRRAKNRVSLFSGSEFNLWGVWGARSPAPYLKGWCRDTWNPQVY